MIKPDQFIWNVLLVEVLPQTCGVKTTQKVRHDRGVIHCPCGMIFTLYQANCRIMNDILLLIATFAGTYLFSMVFVILLMRLIFPFKTKEEIATATIVRTAGQQKTGKRTQTRLPLVHSQRSLTLKGIN